MFRMCLVRLHIALDVAAYQHIQVSILTALWYDVDNRLAIVGVRTR